MVDVDYYKNEHINRIIKATNNLYKQPNSICKKCHSVKGDLNCLFCYCPLYENVDCGGNYIILQNGIKDCSTCLKPHSKEFIKKWFTQKRGLNDNKKRFT